MVVSKESWCLVAFGEDIDINDNETVINNISCIIALIK